MLFDFISFFIVLDNHDLLPLQWGIKQVFLFLINKSVGSFNK